MTAEKILNNYYTEIEKYFIVINEQTEQKILDKLAEAQTADEAKKYKTELKLIRDYLYRPHK